jgi:uncharacterized protein
MVWPLTWVVVAGTLPGFFIGAILRVAYLPNPNNFKLFAAGVLLYIGLKMVWGLLMKNADNANKTNSESKFQDMVRWHRWKTSRQETSGNTSLSAVKVTHFNLKRLRYGFYDEVFEISVYLPNT